MSQQSGWGSGQAVSVQAVPLPRELRHAGFEIRRIQPADNAAIARLVRETLLEFGCVGPGFASSDPELDDLSAAYAGESATTVLTQAYWVVVSQTGQVMGGGGYQRLKGSASDEAVCELQKVYFHAEARGHGLGRFLVRHCMRQAAQAGYRWMYLESMQQMQAALSLYRALGFSTLPTYWGNTGHRSCNVFMSCPLEAETRDC